MIRFFVPMAALLLASACASHPAVLSEAAIPLVQNRALPAPTLSQGVRESRSYVIGPYDKLSIDVFGVPDLSRDVQTDASGNIAFPLIGTIAAGGSTPEELAQRIEERLRGNFVKNPQVTVNLKETVSQVVTVDGQVTKPGLYPVVGRMTLMRAIATAGGMGEYANLQDVVVFRTVGGQRMAGLYSMKAIRAGAYDDPEIYANDVVVVGNSPKLRMFNYLLQGSSLLTTPLLILFRGVGG
jgi:polysaccharide export outer membrane protein